MADFRTRVARILRARWLGASGAARPWEGEPAGPDPDAAAGRVAERGPARTEALRRARAVLEVGAEAGPEEIRSAYRRLCLRYHPDYFAGDPSRARIANELLAEINAAYELLCSSRA